MGPDLARLLAERGLLDVAHQEWSRAIRLDPTLRDPVAAIVAGLRESIGLMRSNATFGDVAEHAREQSWTRDPLDRLIVGTALVDGAPLLPRDDHMLEHFPGAAPLTAPPELVSASAFARAVGGRGRGSGAGATPFAPVLGAFGRGGGRGPV